MKLMAIAYRAIATAAFMASTSPPAMAQSIHTDSVAQANAQKMWEQVPPPVQRCVNLMFSSKKVAFDQIAEAGIAPDDQRISPVINACKQYLATSLRTNLQCTVPNSNGQQVATTCNESYAKEVDGSLMAISGDEMLIAAGNSEEISVQAFETIEAQKARLAEDEARRSTQNNGTSNQATAPVTVEGLMEFLKNDAQRRYRLYNNMVEPLPDGGDILSMVTSQKLKLFNAILSCKHDAFATTHFGIGFRNIVKTPGMGTASLWNSVFETFGDYPKAMSASGDAAFGGPPDDIAVSFAPSDLSLHLTEDGLIADFDGGKVTCRVIKGANLFEWFPNAQ